MTKLLQFVLGYVLPAVATSILTLSVGCNRQVDSKAPERTTQITVTMARTLNLPIIESATGAETAIAFALDYDPTKVTTSTFYVRLPFPTHVANQLRVGQTVRLTSFNDASRSVLGNVREMRPALDATTLSREVIVEVPNGGHWRPIGSIRGEVTLGTHRNAVVVPELAVVLRPAGPVVYVIENGVAREQRVITGMTQDGLMEIVEGLPEGVAVAVDGATLLSSGAKVTIREEPTATGEKSS